MGIALCGTNFCASAKKAMGLIVRNFIRFGMVASLGWITQLIGYAFITGITTILGYFILKGMYPDANPFLPVILICMIGYIIGRLYAMVFQMAVDTALQCYIIVEEQGCEDRSFVPEPMTAFFTFKDDDEHEDKTSQAQGSQGQSSNQQ